MQINEYSPSETQVAYQMFFLAGGRHGQLHEAVKPIVNDLIAFCFGDRTTFHDSSHHMAVAEGRRQVLLHIFSYLELDAVRMHQLVYHET